MPIESKALKGIDSLLSIAQMPAGVAVGTLAIGSLGRQERRPARGQHHRPDRQDSAGECRGISQAADRGSPGATSGMSRVYLPGATIGAMGGGQLGRMFAIAARRMGYRVHVFTPEKDSPAGQFADLTSIADYANEAAVRGFAEGVDVVTFEFENIPVETAEWCARDREFTRRARCCTSRRTGCARKISSLPPGYRWRRFVLSAVRMNSRRRWNKSDGRRF